MPDQKDIDFSVSSVFQTRLTEAFRGDARSKTEIAKEIGISKDVFIRAMNAGLIPSTRTLIKIADYLEISLDYLLGLSDKNTAKKTSDTLSFYERLEQLKTQANKKYGTIAAETGLSRSQFSTWKQKNYVPSLEVCYQLSLYFHTSLDRLLARE